VPQIGRGEVVEIGIRPPAPKPEHQPEPAAPRIVEALPAASAMSENARPRGLRLGRRVDPEELRQRLRGVVVR